MSKMSGNLSICRHKTNNKHEWINMYTKKTSTTSALAPKDNTWGVNLGSHKKNKQIFGLSLGFFWEFFWGFFKGFFRGFFKGCFRGFFWGSWETLGRLLDDSWRTLRGLLDL